MEGGSNQSDPRWLPLLRKRGQAPEQLAAIPFEGRRVLPQIRGHI